MNINTPELTKSLLSTFPNAISIYAFGSRIKGTARPDSDLDLAILVPGYADPIELWEAANQLATTLHYDVDLLDIRAANTVMQHQIITTGKRIYGDSLDAKLYELFILKEKIYLDELRAPAPHDDVLLNKAAIIERTVKRVQEEYQNAGDNFANDYTRQDAAILNIQRACEAALDMGQYIIAKERLGLAQSSRDVFAVLASEQKISAELSTSLQNMIGFRNIAVHEYQKLLLPIVEKIIQEHLQGLLDFSQVMIKNKPSLPNLIG